MKDTAGIQNEEFSVTTTSIACLSSHISTTAATIPTRECIGGARANTCATMQTHTAAGL